MINALQLTIFVLCLSGAFFYAGVETGFVSWNPLKISHRAGLGDTSARWALYLMSHQDRVLSSVLICSNICVIGATLSFLDIAESVAHTLSIDLKNVPSPESWILTPFIVLFCEMLPKSLFRIYPFQLTIRSIPLLLATYYVTLPATWFVSSITKWLRHGKNTQSPEAYLTKVREEMVLIAGIGSRSGTLIEAADRYVANILNLKDFRVGDLTIASIECMQKFSTIKTGSLIGDLHHKKFDDDEIIVFDEKNNPVGMIKLLDTIGVNGRTSIDRFLTPFEIVRSTDPILSVFKDIMRSNFRFSSVINTDGVLIGLIDKEELIRTIFGGIRSNFSL